MFRIGFLTKIFTAILVLQLWQQGRVDLDAPANDYLRTFKLVPAKAAFPLPTVRHLLTHTAGIREMLHLSGLLKMNRVLGETVPRGRRVPSLSEFYRGGLRVDLDPGTSWMYTNHGFAALGEIVENVSDEPLDRRFSERIFEPLGMVSTDLVRSDRVMRHLATGYELRSHGAEAVDCELITVAAGGIYSSARDMARFAAALLAGGANEHGSVLKPETLAVMYQPQYQPDPRLPGMGLAFFRADLGGHLAVEHDGIVPGFDSQIYLAPDDGVGVLVFANGARASMHWLVPEAARVLRQLLGVPDDGIRGDLPQHPEIWGKLCGLYRFSAARTDPVKLAFGARLQVRVHRGRLTARALSPIPALYRGFELHPDDREAPYAFRIDLPFFAGNCRAVPRRDTGGRVDGLHLDMGPMSFRRVSGTRDRRHRALVNLDRLDVAVSALRARWSGPARPNSGEGPMAPAAAGRRALRFSPQARHSEGAMRNALVALRDHSEAARLTEAAATLAGPGGAAQVTHVVEAASGRELEDAGSMVGEAVELLRARGVAASGHVVALAEDGVACSLAERAHASGADLIVMGSRGLGQVGGLFGRSVSHALLSRVSPPVLVVPATARLPLYGFRRVMVALRDEDEAQPAAAAIGLLSPPVEVLAVHVPRWVAVHAGRAGQPAFVEIQETSPIVLAEARKRLREVGIVAAIRTLSPVGGTAAAITEVARTWDADLIVLVSRRLREWEALIAGSTSREVLHLSDRPVLIAGPRATSSGRLG